MIDIATQIKAIDRQVSQRRGPDGEEVSVLIRRPMTPIWPTCGRR